MIEIPQRNTYINQLFSGSHPVVKLFIVLFTILTSLLIFSFVSILLAIPIFHISLPEIEVLFKGNLMEIDIQLLKYIQITQSIALFVIPSIILSYLLFNDKSDNFIKAKFPSFILIIIIFIVMIFSIPMIEKLVQWNQSIKFPSAMAGLEEKITQMEVQAQVLTEKLLNGSRIFDLVLNMIMIALIPAIGEEFLFRGVLQKIFYEWTKNGHLAIFICAFLFSAVHMQFFGFIPRMLLGVLFGYFFFWSRNIWIAVAAHFFNNVIVVVLHFIEITTKPSLPDILSEKSSANIYQVIISVFITAIGIYLVRKKCPVEFIEP
jgi:uncharacterized protein